MKVNLELTNCYGINQLTKEINLIKSDTNNGVNSLYAPNGTLKTSLAKVFKDIESGNESKDLIFPDRECIRDIKVNDSYIESGQVMVIDSYNESYSSQQISTLLVNDELKQQYDSALKEVDDKRSALIRSISKLSGKQAKSIPEIICDAFNRPEKSLLDLLTEISQEDQPDYTQLSELKYGDLFNQKVIDLISTGSFNQDLEEYVDTYEKLISESTILSKTFNHQRAGDISKNLGESGFFTASHSVNLTIEGEKQEVDSKEKLNELLKTEQEKIIQNPELREKFGKVDEKLKTKDTQAFRDFITEHQDLLPEYKDISLLKRKVIIAYLQSQKTLWDDLVDTYKQNKAVVEEITAQARQQKTTWETVVDTFNKRFSVPFKLSIENQDEVILNSAAPAIKFDFDDGRGEIKQVKQSSLIEALSQGEKRALYILNILFEIEIRKQVTHPILLIIDDIADSFDYKNKYAIVEYLRDISKFENFHLLLLTHNFDFHRIISSRLGAKRNNRLMAIKSPGSIKIVKEKYQNDVFKAWKQELNTNESYLLASIPFARNIAEYCGHEDHFNTLTSLLHLKEDTRDIKISHLQEVYRNIFTDLSEIVILNGDERILDKILQYSDKFIAANNESPELECKVILAMAIRIKAEEFMIRGIADADFVNSITSNQTRVLFDRYVEDQLGDEETISLLDQVNLMTPENIHLNSFMYEPILDMSAHRLYQLYSDISQLPN
ncbi:hypothetical protein SAMN05421831_10274 [Allopseudospirillum japonicum]|uniref:Wobble nucleotide-excising tRNase n=1 Tax=Allopseudospirillum japonicum TaxID=64971 RepID=A0A1H6QWP7_9GAMM|nr:hypothetical protein [Allopseudospirillum japonicum]SEI45384.1 hypothetical protein SAMN05421831_10274 [Allopseudospirillum japonicum]